MQDPKQILDSINGILTSGAALLAIVTPWVIKLWRLVTTKEHVARVSGTLDILERIARTHVLALEQTEARYRRDANGKLPPEQAAKLKEEAMRGMRADYGDSWVDTARKLGFSLEQLDTHVAKVIEAAVFTVKALTPPPTLPPFGGLTEAEKRALHVP